MSLADSVLNGDRLALARLLTRVENDTIEGREALDVLFPHTGKAHLIGVTGAPGTGKSTLVNQIALSFRKLGQRVAIVAIDPSSPFTGGAVLGDRVRMRDLAGDTGVFIRSMASRGSLGGLAQATAGLVQVFDSAGFEIILIETVGAGQSEVDIARLAHTTLVVEAPGLGDEIQAIKAGILEIADILVINKADRPGVESTERALKNMLEMAHPVPKIFQHHGQTLTETLPDNPSPNASLWFPLIQRTVATDGAGLPQLIESIQRHAAHLRQSGEWLTRERARLEAEFDLFIQQELVARFRAGLPEAKLAQIMESIQNRKISPREAVSVLLNGGVS
ncbi:MAG: methylmalonyl Co-A mutase-associated GTPase MeaB [Chloroflexi bacterium]|nr:methylmalonyl Co-A mutase-associated GTPase MeaB [Chloroflexota bacterium]